MDVPTYHQAKWDFQQKSRATHNFDGYIDIIFVCFICLQTNREHHDYLKLNAGPIFHFPPRKLWQQKSLRIIHRGCIAKALKHDGLLDWCPPLEEIEWRSEIHAYSFAIGATFGNCDNFSDLFLPRTLSLSNSFATDHFRYWFHFLPWDIFLEKRSEGGRDLGRSQTECDLEGKP